MNKLVLTIFILCFVLLEFMMRLHLWFMIIYELTKDQKGQILWQYKNDDILCPRKLIFFGTPYHRLSRYRPPDDLHFREQSEKRTA